MLHSKYMANLPTTPLPDGPDPSSLLKEVRRTFGDYDGPWEFRPGNDSLVFASTTRLVKIAQSSVKETSLAKGAALPRTLVASGIAALLPLNDELMSTPLGLASVWPLIEHLETTPETLSYHQARRLGRAVASIAHYEGPVPDLGDHFEYAHREIDSSLLSASILARAHALTTLVQNATAHLYTGPQAFAHGDLHLFNALFLPDDTLTIIDWDYAGVAPLGWDVAYLRTHLLLTCAARDRFNDVFRAYQTAGGLVPTRFGPLCLVNTLLGLTFRMTSNPDEAYVIHLLDTIETWVTTQREPSSLD